MIINVCKEKNMTSRDVVNIISKHLHTKKVGHTGTLDPLATGVLIVCTNHDTKLVDILTSKNKEYIATMRLGIQTDTGDITGNIIKRATYKVTKDQIIKVLNNFLGSSTQTVPIYSAVKINGKKLYEYARNGEEVTLPTREINISSIELLDYHDDLIKFKVTVSKGTYIRSLIEDIGKTLQTVATMEDLVRTKQGNYKIEDSYTLEDIKNDNYKSIPLNIVLKDYHTYNLSATEYFKVKNGSKMLLNIDDKIVTLLYNNKPIALYRKENDIYRVYKMLEINTDDNWLS